MNLKRFVAPDMRQALKKIRDELGPDAVILSNNRVDGGIEITAALDYDEELFARLGGGVPATESQPPAREAESADGTAQNAALHGRSREPERQQEPQLKKEPQRRREPQRQKETQHNAKPAPSDTHVSGQNQVDSAFAHLLNQFSHSQGHTVEDNQGEPDRVNPVTAETSHNRRPTGGDGDEELLTLMRSEIESLRLLLKDQMADSRQERWSFKHPLEAGVFDRFRELKVSASIARRLAQRVASHSTIAEGWRAALALLAKEIPTTGEDLVAGGGLFAFIGPTGVGKTTTVAKLAIRYALKHGREGLALVTTDRYRMAAYEQLRTLGRILDVPVSVVDERNSLDRVLRSLKHKSLVLVDTAGLQQDNRQRAAQLDELDRIEGLKRLLVLPATSQGAVLKTLLAQLAAVEVDACILSKLDEAAGLGEVLSLVLEKRLPVAYITNGQSIPDDLQLARPNTLVARLLRGDRAVSLTTGLTDDLTGNPVGYPAQESPPNMTRRVPLDRIAESARAREAVAVRIGT